MTPQQPDPRPGLYYISVVRSGRDWRPLLGPFARHEDALAMVEWAHDTAIDVDPFATFYAFGTCRLEPDAAKVPKGTFNERSGLPAWSFAR